MTREDGSPHPPKRLSSTFTTQTDRLGMPRIGFHGLRRTYATTALRAGVSPEVVSRRLGHLPWVITLTLYAHVFEQDHQAAADRVAGVILGGRGQGCWMDEEPRPHFIHYAPELEALAWIS